MTTIYLISLENPDIIYKSFKLSDICENASALH